MEQETCQVDHQERRQMGMLHCYNCEEQLQTREQAQLNAALTAYRRTFTPTTYAQKIIRAELNRLSQTAATAPLSVEPITGPRASESGS